jgi:hypothetical protein
VITRDSAQEFAFGIQGKEWTNSSDPYATTGERLVLDLGPGRETLDPLALKLGEEITSGFPSLVLVLLLVVVLLLFVG